MSCVLVTCNISCVMCQPSHVRCHMSFVMYHMSPTTTLCSFSSYENQAEENLSKKCHLSCVNCHKHQQPQQKTLHLLTPALQCTVPYLIGSLLQPCSGCPNSWEFWPTCFKIVLFSIPPRLGGDLFFHFFLNFGDTFDRQVFLGVVLYIKNEIFV